MTALIDRLGGLAATHELHRAGFDRGAIASAVRRRTILRVRQGWYARPTTERTLLAAARVGGRATCVTGLRLHGIWVSASRGLHVVCPAHSARLRSQRDSRIRLRARNGVTVHWRDVTAQSRLIVPPLECLRDAVSCLDGPGLAQSADSLLHTRPELRPAWPGFVSSVSARVRTTLTGVDGVCESGIETSIWQHLRTRSPAARRQVTIKPAGRVDFVVGDRLVIEADGAEYHTDERQFEEDRRRDAALATLDYRVLRFSYRQVMNAWPDVASAIDAAIAN